MLTDLTAALAADRVYEPVGALAADPRAELAALEASPEVRPWQRLHPDFKPRLSGLRTTLLGPQHRITVLLDTVATHCFICAPLAAALGLPLSGQPWRRRCSFTHAWATRFARSCRSHRWTWTLAMPRPPHFLRRRPRQRLVGPRTAAS